MNFKFIVCSDDGNVIMFIRQRNLKFTVNRIMSLNALKTEIIIFFISFYFTCFWCFYYWNANENSFLIDWSDENHFTTNFLMILIYNGSLCLNLLTGVIFLCLFCNGWCLELAYIEAKLFQRCLCLQVAKKKPQIFIVIKISRYRFLLLKRKTRSKREGNRKLSKNTNS